jgi:hypothetical protein
MNSPTQHYQPAENMSIRARSVILPKGGDEWGRNFEVMSREKERDSRAYLLPPQMDNDRLITGNM